MNYKKSLILFGWLACVLLAFFVTPKLNHQHYLSHQITLDCTLTAAQGKLTTHDLKIINQQINYLNQHKKRFSIVKINNPKSNVLQHFFFESLDYSEVHFSISINHPKNINKIKEVLVKSHFKTEIKTNSSWDIDATRRGIYIFGLIFILELIIVSCFLNSASSGAMLLGFSIISKPIYTATAFLFNHYTHLDAWNLTNFIINGFILVLLPQILLSSNKLNKKLGLMIVPCISLLFCPSSLLRQLAIIPFLVIISIILSIIFNVLTDNELNLTSTVSKDLSKTNMIKLIVLAIFIPILFVIQINQQIDNNDDNSIYHCNFNNCINLTIPVSHKLNKRDHLHQIRQLSNYLEKSGSVKNVYSISQPIGKNQTKITLKDYLNRHQQDFNNLNQALNKTNQSNIDSQKMDYMLLDKHNSIVKSDLTDNNQMLIKVIKQQNFDKNDTDNNTILNNLQIIQNNNDLIKCKVENSQNEYQKVIKQNQQLIKNLNDSQTKIDKINHALAELPALSQINLSNDLIMDNKLDSSKAVQSFFKQNHCENIVIECQNEQQILPTIDKLKKKLPIILDAYGSPSKKFELQSKALTEHNASQTILIFGIILIASLFVFNLNYNFQSFSHFLQIAFQILLTKSILFLPIFHLSISESNLTILSSLLLLLFCEFCHLNRSMFIMQLILLSGLILISNQYFLIILVISVVINSVIYLVTK